MGQKLANVHHHFAFFFKNYIELQPFAYTISKSLSEGSICIDPTADQQELFDGKASQMRLRFSA